MQMGETVLNAPKQPSKMPLKLLLLLMLLSPPFFLSLPILLCYIITLIDTPPGYSDWFLPREWDANSIGDFLAVRIPADATTLQIEGRKGSLGQYGINPTLEFSFSAAPENALAFVNSVCNIVYVGYNPFASTETYRPVSDSVLVRGGLTIHYSYSPSAPETTLGNRCNRRGYLTEIVLDTADVNMSRVFYRLQANRNHPEYYAMAELVMPLENFQLYATGLREQGQTFVLTYPMICLETGFLFRNVDYGFYVNRIEAYEDSEIALFVDDILQPSASIQDGALKEMRSPNDNTESLERWDYCLSNDWQAGTHTVQMRVTPPQGDIEVFEWTFDVLES
jgi:hypothetical protein